MVLPSVLIYKTFLERSKADTVYICATNLCDGRRGGLRTGNKEDKTKP